MTIFEYALISFIITSATLGAMVALIAQFFNMLAR